MVTGLEIVGVVFAAPPVIELCIKVAQSITHKMEQNKEMKENMQHLRIFTVETGQARLKHDVHLVDKIVASFMVEQQDKDTLRTLFDHVVELLNQIDANVNTVLEKSGAIYSRKKRAALAKLKDQTRDLSVTLDNFHDMTMSLSIRSISETGMFLDEYAFVTIGAPAERKHFNDRTFVSSGRLSNGSKGVQEYVLESTPYEAFEEGYVRKNLDRLTQLLAGSTSAEGILPLVGFRKDALNSEFQLVFAADSQVTIGETLQQKNRPDTEMPSLNVRIGICALLAEAILHVHSLGLVHKNVRPENVLLVEDKELGGHKLFLLGWQYARGTVDFQSVLAGESQPERGVYQHPQRQVRQQQRAEEDYCMGHDIYSLGVCMLEVLTWRSLVQQQGPDDEQRPVFCDDFKSTYNELGFPQSDSDSTTAVTEEEKMTEVPSRVQQVLLSLVNKKVPGAAGCRMEKIVVRCLTCLESEDDLGGGQGRNPQQVGADFVDAVLKDIRGICSAI